MSRTSPEYLDRGTSDCSLAAHVLVREEPDEEEEDEEEDDRKEDDEDEDDGDDGYSEVSVLLFVSLGEG
jgi:hypothetical protein